MAVQNNFVIKNGLEVNGSLIFADRIADQVGIGTTNIDGNCKMEVLGNIRAENLYLKESVGLGSIYNIKGNDLNYYYGRISSGVVTSIVGTSLTYTNGNIDNLYSQSGIITSLTGNSLNYTIADINSIRLDSGTISSPSGIVTYYGDGRFLDISNNEYMGVGIGNSLGIVGYGVSFLDLRGTGISSISYNDTVGIATVVFNVGGVDLNDTLLIGNVTSIGLQVGVITATAFVKSGGTSLQFLKADGSIDSTTYLSVEADSISIDNISAGIVTANLFSGGNVNAGIITANLFSGGNVNAGIITANLFSGGNVNAGIITANSFVKFGGTSSQFLKADGSIDSNTYLTVETQTLDDVLTLGNTSSLGISVGVITCTDINSTSDFNLKENITTVDNALNIVNDLRGVRFEWKKDHKPSYGVIAQELEKILPELVTDTDPKTVNYNGIIGVLIEAIKELKNEVEELKRYK